MENEIMPLASNLVDSGGLEGAFMGVFAGAYIFFMLIIGFFYVYFGLTYWKIGEKAGLSSPGIAWLPFYGPLATIYEASKSHWWPFPLFVAGFLIGYPLLFMGFTSIIFTVLGILVLVGTFGAFFVMAMVWHWKTYEAVNKPGWWAIIPLACSIFGFLLIVLGSLVSGFLSILGFLVYLGAFISHMVFLGIAAWSKN